MSMLMHVEAVRLVAGDPSLTQRLLLTLQRWRLTADPRTYAYFDEWERILQACDWPTALANTEHGAALRQASPMATLLDGETRLAIIQHVKRTLAAS